MSNKNSKKRESKKRKKITKADIEGKRLLSIEQAGWYLDVSPQTIYNGICRNSVRPFPVKCLRRGRFVKFDIKDLDRYIDELKKENN